MRIDQYPLLYNARAYFAFKKQYDGVELFDVILKDDEEGMQSLCGIYIALAEQAELVRRREGYDPRELPEMETMLAELLPSQLPTLRETVANAITRGVVPPDNGKPVDEVLLEIKKKTRKG